MLLIVTSTGEELFGGIYLDDLKRPWTPKIKGVSDFLRSPAAVHTAMVNCLEMAEDKPRQCANRNY